ncbi:MAG: hypothetical protein ACON38_05715 [Akkermansiaceae bacterium]
MRSLTILLLALLATGCDDKQPAEIESKPELKQFSLVVTDDFEVVPYSDSFNRWTSSLIKNLGYQRDKITCVEFLRTNLQLTSGGQPIERAVYIHRSNPDVFFIREHHLIVDFDEKFVGYGPGGGMSLHFSTSGNLGAILVPGRVSSMNGLPLGDPKTDSPEPVFSTPRSVRYELIGN